MDDLRDQVARAILAEARIANEPGIKRDADMEYGRAAAKRYAQAALTTILAAIKTPTEGMMKAVDDQDLQFGSPAECYAVDVPRLYTAMIEQLIKEVSGE